MWTCNETRINNLMCEGGVINYGEGRGYKMGGGDLYKLYPYIKGGRNFSNAECRRGEGDDRNRSSNAEH